CGEAARPPLSVDRSPLIRSLSQFVLVLSRICPARRIISRICYSDAMRRLPIFWQIFLAYGVLIVPSLGVLGSTVVAWVEQQMLQQVEQELRTTAILI